MLHLLRVKSLKVPFCQQSLFCHYGHSSEWVDVETRVKVAHVFFPVACHSDTWEAALCVSAEPVGKHKTK